MSSERQLSVSVKYGEVEVNFSGSPEVVIRSLHEFIAKQIPNMDLARSISVNYSLNDLIQLFKEYIRFTEEGPRVWAQDRDLSDKDVISLQLVAAKAANLSGKLGSDSMSVSELEAATALNPKTIGSRLSELNKLGYVERRDSGGVGSYRATTTGIHWLATQLTKKHSRQSQAVAPSP
ncbi:MAG: winged helix-turn-helix domain-containing protein [Thaumarchaeota archaeon]|nr:winged helix-turn-helix domain-containing protein [Nitrososphaerota archaeon]